MSSLAFLKEPTMTRTARKNYERSIVKLFRSFRKQVLERFDDTRMLAAEPTAIDIAAFSLAVEELATAVIVTSGESVIEEKIPGIYSNGLRFADLRTGHAVNGSLGPADWRAIDAIKVRNLTALKKITNEMNGQIIREVTEGMLEGEHPRVIAKRITGRVDAIGIVRAQTMAQTEVITAFNRGAEIRYQQYGYTHWSWLAALDERTCDQCGPLDGKKFKFGGSQQIPPIHPNCRCTILPAEE
ncbi:phage head morphogenesis protein [Methanococcoides sp. FTZ1]|uniref:phage head morphogenesis protein n=1 Tax=Methanococcoides sp. FTZ1 TaxID=3439061 RepID=UPI003F87AEAE